MKRLGFEKHLKALSVALFALVLLSLSTNVMLYLQIKLIEEEKDDLSVRLSEIEAEVNDIEFWLSQIQAFVSRDLHVRTIAWDKQDIPAGKKIEGYVANWTVDEQVRIVGIEIWMGNPYDILWEGDTFVMLNNTVNPWNPPPDTVLAHYQFDSHDKSPVPHQRSFGLPYGFLIDAGETLFIYRLFNNFDEEDTYSGDGWIILHYTTE